MWYFMKNSIKMYYAFSLNVLFLHCIEPRFNASSLHRCVAAILDNSEHVGVAVPHPSRPHLSKSDGRNRRIPFGSQTSKSCN